MTYLERILTLRRVGHDLATEQWHFFTMEQLDKEPVKCLRTLFAGLNYH